MKLLEKQKNGLSTQEDQKHQDTRRGQIDGDHITMRVIICELTNVSFELIYGFWGFSLSAIH